MTRTRYAGDGGPDAARNAVESVLGERVSPCRPVGGGDISEAYRCELPDGTPLFVKLSPGAPPGFVEAEVRGLRALEAAGAGTGDRGAGGGGVPVPSVRGSGPDVLVLDWLEPGRPAPDAAVGLGRSLAATHATATAAFGVAWPGWIGSLPLPEGRSARVGADVRWPEFYARWRLEPYLRSAVDRGSIGTSERAAVEQVIDRLEDLAGESGGEPPRLLHGDLWSGNVVWCADGRARVVDPAVQGGHRETDLAMLALFGCPHLDAVLAGYELVAPLTAGWRQRVGLHQLHPLLVHAVLFGGGYGSRAGAVARDAVRRLG